MRYFINLKNLILTPILWIFITQVSAISYPALQSQGIVVRGEVRESNTNIPLAGVSVRIKGEPGTTVTDANGKYEIRVSAKQNMLVFSYTGKKSQERLVGDNITIDVTLEDDATLISEV